MKKKSYETFDPVVYESVDGRSQSCVISQNSAEERKC